MLNYQVIAEANAVSERLRRDHYNRAWGGDMDHTRDGDRLALFTLEPQAQRDSLENIQKVLNVARDHGQDLVVAKTNLIQVAGPGPRSQEMADLIAPQQWRLDYQQWLGSNNPSPPRFDASGLGELCELRTWRPALIMREHQGVYDVATGKRLTARREIIERMWALGFAAHRGRPLSIARQRWTGNRQELELTTQLAEQHWDRRRTSEVAKKLCSVFTSINRYAAWPGAW
jgi:hypothetical protein